MTGTSTCPSPSQSKRTKTRALGAPGDLLLPAGRGAHDRRPRHGSSSSRERSRLVRSLALSRSLFADYPRSPRRRGGRSGGSAAGRLRRARARARVAGRRRPDGGGRRHGRRARRARGEGDSWADGRQTVPPVAASTRSRGSSHHRVVRGRGGSNGGTGRSAPSSPRPGRPATARRPRPHRRCAPGAEWAVAHSPRPGPGRGRPGLAGAGPRRSRPPTPHAARGWW